MDHVVVLTSVRMKYLGVLKNYILCDYGTGSTLVLYYLADF